MISTHKLEDMILRIEIDLQKAKEALRFDSDYNHARNKMISISEQSISVSNFLFANLNIKED